MLRIALTLAWSSLVVTLVAGLSFGTLARHAAAAQNAHPGPVTGVIDGVTFEGDQYYAHGWACQEVSEARLTFICTRTILPMTSQQGPLLSRARRIWRASLPLTAHVTMRTAENIGSRLRCPTS